MVTVAATALTTAKIAQLEYSYIFSFRAAYDSYRQQRHRLMFADC